jgi:hypothetical protein
MELRRRTKSRPRVEQLEDRYTPAAPCLVDPLFCGPLGGGASVVTADAEGPFSENGLVCPGGTENLLFTVTTPGTTVQHQSQASFGICVAVVAASGVENADPCPVG